MVLFYSQATGLHSLQFTCCTSAHLLHSNSRKNNTVYWQPVPFVITQVNTIIQLDTSNLYVMYVCFKIKHLYVSSQERWTISLKILMFSFTARNVVQESLKINTACGDQSLRQSSRFKGFETSTQHEVWMYGNILTQCVFAPLTAKMPMITFFLIRNGATIHVFSTNFVLFFHLKDLFLTWLKTEWCRRTFPSRSHTSSVE